VIQIGIQTVSIGGLPTNRLSGRKIRLDELLYVGSSRRVGIKKFAGKNPEL